MRIIAGEWKGCRLEAPAGEIARPTTDRVKESMFNLLGLSWSGGVVVDLFAGSGALGLEAVSRGADKAVLVDKNNRSIQAIRENVRRCRAESRCDIMPLDWRKAWSLVEQRYSEISWVFVDPPYRLNLWEDVLLLLSGSTVDIRYGVVCEHPKGDILPASIGKFDTYKDKTYGDIAITIFRSGDIEEDES